jgi:hypothetical protein
MAERETDARGFRFGEHASIGLPLFVGDLDKPCLVLRFQNRLPPSATRGGAQSGKAKLRQVRNSLYRLETRPLECRERENLPRRKAGYFDELAPPAESRRTNW